MQTHSSLDKYKGEIVEVRFNGFVFPALVLEVHEKTVSLLGLADDEHFLLPHEHVQYGHVEKLYDCRVDESHN